MGVYHNSLNKRKKKGEPYIPTGKRVIHGEGSIPFQEGGGGGKGQHRKDNVSPGGCFNFRGGGKETGLQVLYVQGDGPD